MTLTPWRSRSPALRTGDGNLSRLRNEMERTFDRFFNDPFGLTAWESGVPSFRAEGWFPAIDVSETANEVTIRTEAPGVATKDLDISVSGNTLTISGKKDESQERKDENYYCCERQFGSFRRSVDLPDTVDADRITADSDSGVVTIHVPKKPGVKPRQIEVKPLEKKVPVSSAAP